MKSASALESAPDLSGLSIKVGFVDVGVTGDEEGEILWEESSPFFFC